MPRVELRLPDAEPQPWPHTWFLEDVRTLSTGERSNEWYVGQGAWPPLLEELSLYTPNLLYVPPQWPPALHSLKLGMVVKLSELPQLPDNLKELTLNRCWGLLSWLQCLPSLPAGLEKFGVSEGLDEVDPLLAEPHRLKRLPAFGPALRSVTFANCPRLELTAAQLDRLDALQCRFERLEDGIYVNGFAGPGEVRENLRARDLLSAVRRVYQMAEARLPEADAAVWQHEASQLGASAEPLTSLLFRMWAERSSERGGVKSIAGDMVPTLSTMVRHPEILPHVASAADCTADGCVNQPVKTWRHVAALVAVHVNVQKAEGVHGAVEASRMLLAQLAVDETAPSILGKIRCLQEREIREAGGSTEAVTVAHRGIRDNAPEIANLLVKLVDEDRRAMGYPAMPGVPRAVAHMDEKLIRQVTAHKAEAIAAVNAVMNAPIDAPVGRQPDLIRMLCRGDHAGWWEMLMLQRSQAAQRDFGPEGSIAVHHFKKLEELHATASGDGAFLEKMEHLKVERREAVAAALDRHTRESLPKQGRFVSPPLFGTARNPVTVRRNLHAVR